MRMVITLDEKTKEVVERLSNIVGVSQSCVFSFGIYLVCQKLNKNDDELFESLFDYTENYYKVNNKQGGRNEKTQTFAKKSQNLSDSRRLPTVKEAKDFGLKCLQQIRGVK